MFYNFFKSKLFGSICSKLFGSIVLDSEISSMNLLEKSSMAFSISMSVYYIAPYPSIFENRHGLTSLVSHVPLLTSVPLNLMSDELARLLRCLCFSSH